MRIQHNIMAMSAYRNYTNNVNAMKKNLEKLSSGYKINRAGDDAAGLAISEKMRAQITGLQQAQNNAKSGINLVQTAEGALTEVHDMLNRMVKLADQSANGTYDDSVDRNQLQKEMDQLRSEINRISESSNFNGIKLLNGDLDGGSSVGAASTVTVQAVADGDHDGSAAVTGVYSFDIKDLVVYGGGTKNATIAALSVGGQALITANTQVSLTDGVVKASDIMDKITKTSIQIDGVSYNITKDGTKIILTQQKVPATSAQVLHAKPANMKVVLTVGSKDSTNQSFDLTMHVDKEASELKPSKVAQGSFTLSADQITDGGQITIGKDTYTFKVGKDSTVTGNNVIDLSASTSATLLKDAYMALSQQSNSLFDITTDGSKITLTEKMDGEKFLVDYDKDWNLKGTSTAGDGKWNQDVKGNTANGVVKVAVASAGSGTGLTLQIGDTSDSFNQLKVNIGKTDCAALGIDKISIADQTSAAAAVDAIRSAINKVSDVRGTLGATQNRLDHTINNLSVMTENIQDAESTIRDTDVAEEMMAYTKNNILIQSAQAMLAQANQVPQGVLQLLQ